jgi:hypothetical protein
VKIDMSLETEVPKNKYYINNGEIKLGKFIEVNDTACNRSGYRKQEFMQMSPDKLDSNNFDNNKEKILKDLVQKGEGVIPPMINYTKLIYIESNPVPWRNLIEYLTNIC